VCCSPNNIKVKKLRRMELAGHVACKEDFRNSVLCRAEKLNGGESSFLTLFYNSMEGLAGELDID
jgi:hypothetical protein